MTVGPVHGEAGEPAGSVCLLADVTQRRALEDQLRQAQKMDAVGRLAGGVAHDFNNLLTGVTGNLTMALEATPPDDPRREFLLSAEQAAWRAAELTQQLLGFSRRTKPRMGPVDLNACVREAVDLLRRTLGPAIGIAPHFADGTGRGGGGRRPDQSGPDEPVPERPRRHAGGRPSRTGDGQHRR